jgi:hypothetical protein
MRPRLKLNVEALEARDVPATFFVTNTSGNVATANSLPWAVAQANATAAFDSIEFYIGAFNSNTRQYINLTAPLTITAPVSINGETQYGWARGNNSLAYDPTQSPGVQVYGFPAISNIFTFAAGSTGSRLQGLGIWGFTQTGIQIQDGTNNNIIRNNWIGNILDSGGGVRLNTENGTQSIGVSIQSDFNVIFNNTISGLKTGVIVGDGAANVTAQTNGIFSNRIGTNPTGTTKTGYGNTSDGIQLGSGASGTFVGWDATWTSAFVPKTLTDGNTISGNAGMGVNLRTSTTNGNVVYKNTIGLDINRTTAQGNGAYGVQLHNGASGNAIGGPFGGNVLSANGYGGVSLGTNWTGENGPANGNWVQNNIIGLNGQQTAVVAGQGVGITITNTSTRNVVQGNVIAGNQSHGVWINNAQTNNVTNNWIGKSSAGFGFANAHFGILLLSGASFNFVGPNDFGINTLGNYYVDGAAIGNAF